MSLVRDHGLGLSIQLRSRNRRLCTNNRDSGGGECVRKELICYGRRTGQSAAALLDIRAERKKVREIPSGTYVYSVTLCWL